VRQLSSIHTLTLVSQKKKKGPQMLGKRTIIHHKERLKSFLEESNSIPTTFETKLAKAFGTG
jgi:hypothetical protein